MLDVVEFRLDEVRLGLPLDRVVEIIPRVLITPLPETPKHVLGVLAYRGSLVVAVDLRQRLGHPARRPAPEDHLIVARGARRMVAIVADRVDGLLSLPSERVEPPPVRTPHLAGIATLDTGLLLLEELDAALSLEEERAIDAGLTTLGLS